MNLERAQSKASAARYSAGACLTIGPRRQVFLQGDEIPQNLDFTPNLPRTGSGQISDEDRTSTSRFHRFILRQPLLECEHPKTSVISGMQSTHAISADEISGMQSTHAFNQCNQFGIDSGHGGSQWSAEYAPSGICPLIIDPTEVVR